MWSSPTVSAALSASSICCGVGVWRNGTPFASSCSVMSPTHAPAKQSACSSVRTPLLSGTRAVVRVLLHDPGDLLHVVAVLVREHVQLGERPGGGVELLAQQREERRVDVDRLLGRAVERPGRVGGRPALGARGAVDDDQLRLAVPLDGGSPSTGRSRGMPRRAGSRRWRSRPHRSRSCAISVPLPGSWARRRRRCRPEMSLPVNSWNSSTAMAPSPAMPPPATATPPPRRRAVFPPTLALSLKVMPYTYPRTPGRAKTPAGGVGPVKCAHAAIARGRRAVSRTNGRSGE